MVTSNDCVPFSVASAPDTLSISIVAVLSPSKAPLFIELKVVVPVVEPAEIVISDIFE